MAHTCKVFREFKDVLAEMPDNVYFDSSGKMLSFQTEDEDEANMISMFFPKIKWKKTWDTRCFWWSWTAKYRGYTIMIYAIKGKPPKPID